MSTNKEQKVDEEKSKILVNYLTKGGKCFALRRDDTAAILTWRQINDEEGVKYTLTDNDLDSMWIVDNFEVADTVVSEKTSSGLTYKTPINPFSYEDISIVQLKGAFPEK